MLKFPLRKVYVFFFCVLIFMLHLPFAFSTSKPLMFTNQLASSYETANEGIDREEAIAALYTDLQLGVKGLSEEAFTAALKGFDKLTESGEIVKDNLITIIDFTRPSTAKRMFVIDMINEKIIFHTYVAHGRGSGKVYAESFSNIPESFQSSLGFYETSGTYIGKNGFSMKLKGLENGINNKAEERAVVVHGAPYVSENFINSNGYLGRSHGCPALPQNLNKPIIEKIKNGTCLFIYSEKANYLNRSKLLNS